MRWIHTTLASLAVLLCAGAAVADGPRQVRVVWTEAPQSRALIAWTTDVAGEEHVVHFDTRSRGGAAGAYAQQLACQRNGQHTYDGLALFYHHALLEGLEPATTYWFVVASDGASSRELHFRTAPASDSPVVFLQGGDSRSNAESRQGMNRRIAALVAEDPDLLCLAHGGDYVWSGSRLDLWDAWLTDHELTITDAGRVLPIVPARGNHEAYGPLYDEVFGWPGGGLGKNWFATRLSPEVLLVTLNTEAAAGGPQTRFLEATAEAARGVRWKLAQYHRPIFPVVKRPARAKPHWQPIFDAERFDLICEADGHTLRRTVPILGEARHEDGVVYIGEGGLGVKQRKPNTDLWYVQPPGFTTSAHHVWKLALSPSELRCEAVTLDGEIADRWSRAPRPRQQTAGERLHALEQRLLGAKSFEIEYEVQSSGAFATRLNGEIVCDGDALRLLWDGEFGDARKRGELTAAGGTLVIRDHERGTSTELEAAPRAPLLRESIVIGLTRMGILHNLARVTHGAPPDRADGSVREWVRATDCATRDGAIAFGIEVGGRPSGEASLWLDAVDGLPARRTQTVDFGGGKKMHVTESYEVVRIDD